MHSRSKIDQAFASLRGPARHLKSEPAIAPEAEEQVSVVHTPPWRGRLCGGTSGVDAVRVLRHAALGQIRRSDRRAVREMPKPVVRRPGDGAFGRRPWPGAR
jgi:hypothetical protein